MKSKWIFVFAIAFFSFSDATADAVNYEVKIFGTAGGTSSQANSLNDRGWAAGAANIDGDEYSHAVIWADGEQKDLGTLGGRNSGVFWPVNGNSGVIVGISETAEENPLREVFSCGYFFPTDFTTRPERPVCRGFRWERGVMAALPTLGGYNSYATGANSAGQVVGWAETEFRDPTCTSPQVLQFWAVIWGPDGKVQPLPPLPGHSSSAATAINDKGQVVGISGQCGIAVGGVSAASAVIWENGVPRDIGNLGGHTWNTPTAISNHGTVVGFSLPEGQDGTRNYEAFIWTEEDGMRSLGKAAGDIRSAAFGINERDQVVGLARSASGVRALMWEDGEMIEINSRTVEGSPHLLYANDINDRGEIVGQALDPQTGENRGYVAVPTVEAASGAKCTTAATARRELPANLGHELRRRFFVDLISLEE